MKADKLRDNLTRIETWCREKDISLFYGSTDDIAVTQVSWTKDSNDSWSEYLSIAEKTKVKIIIIEISTNETNTDDEQIGFYKELLEDEILKEFEKSLAIVNKVKGHVTFYKLHFFFDNICYSYTQSSEWLGDLVTVEDAFLEEDEEVKSVISKPLIERLTEDRIEELARKIILNEAYLSTKNSIQRSDIVETLLKQDSISDFRDIWAVRQKSESIYENEIKPKQEEEIRIKVLELKSKGLKKVEIASKLGISSGMVNKFYYTDEMLN